MKKIKVITIGTFDVPHAGHLRLLKRCAKLGEVHIGVNSDEFVKSYKKKPPVFTYQERVDSMREWGFKHFYKNSQPDGTVKDLIERVKPDIIAIGTDWLRKPYLVQIGLDVEYLEENNISLIFFPYTKGISSSEIKRRLS